MTELQDHLDEITANTRKLVQPERLAISERSVEELFATGIEQQILAVGEMAPDFNLNDSSRRPVSSRDLLSLGPLVINFFRGRWCPYCVTELETWRDLYRSVRDRGALLVGISPQNEKQSDFTTQQHLLPYPLLSDPGCMVAEEFKLAYTLSELYQEYYRSILVNIPFINGDESWKLPLPATYVLASDGRIVYAEAFADFRVRPEPEDVLSALSGLRFG
jgi:peroxiredoxin